MRVLLASTKAAGTGLNLTCACRVLILDVWWTWAHEDQVMLSLTSPWRQSDTNLTQTRVLTYKSNVDAIRIGNPDIFFWDGVIVAGLLECVFICAACCMQAIARSHRLGQLREVKVSKLIMKMRAPDRETVEQRIMQMQVSSTTC